MASRPTVGNSKQLNIESERLAISLAITIEEGDADKFSDIYDSSIPAEFGQIKVESIKERVRVLLEHPEELETLKADFQVADDLMSKLSQTFLGKDTGFMPSPSNGLKSEEIAHRHPSDVNHNFCSVSGSVSMEGREELVPNKYVDLNKRGSHPVDTRTDNVSDTSDKGKGLFPKKHGTFSGSSHMRDNDVQLELMSSKSTSNKPKLEQVDDKIDFGSISKLQKVKENSVSPVKIKRDILPTKKNVNTSDHTDGFNAVGPHSPHKLLGNAVNLIRKPSEADVKNCPAPEPIEQNHRADSLITEATPILGHSKSDRGAKIPQKRHGEQQREREVEDVYPDDNPVLSTTVPANFCYNNYGTMQGPHLPGNESLSKNDSKIEDSNAMNREAVRKKKRKKKKKSKPGDNGAESTTEGEEVKSPSTEVNKPPSLSSDRNSTRKISAESSSERENLSGESDGKVHQTPDKRTDLKEKLNDKNMRTKESGISKKKKGEQKRKSQKDENLESVNKVIHSKEDDNDDEVDDNSEEHQVQKESEKSNFGSKKESSVFALRRRAADDASGFHSNSEHVKENDCRSAMSDPGENDDGDGEFNVVTNRRSRRRPKEAGHFGHQGYSSRNFMFYDAAGPRYDRNQDAPWYIRKSSSLPKEMCNYSSARKRMGMSEAEEPVSTTTTTTTASSRRDSLESDENIDQKRFSYASKLKVNIQANSTVQSGPDANREIAGNKEVLDTPSSQSNSKPKIYSITKDKKDDPCDLLVHPPSESATMGKGPPSSSITSAMNLEVGVGNSSSHKFDINFPNLTGNKTNEGAYAGGEEGGTRSVQYLDLQCTNNTYAGRVKQSLSNSNKMSLQSSSEAVRNDDSLRTTESGPEMAKSQAGQKICTIENKMIPLVGKQEKELSSLNHVKPLVSDADTTSDIVFVANKEQGDSIEQGSNMGYTASESNIQTESCARAMETDLQGSQVGTDSQPSNLLRSSENDDGGNPIWFGSLLVSDNQIVILNDSHFPQDNLTQEGGWTPPDNSSEPSQVKPKDFAAEYEKTFSPPISDDKKEMGKIKDSVSVTLMSGHVVKIKTDDHSVKMGRFNLVKVREMLCKDWETTVQQGQEFPETVQHILD